MSPSAFPTPPFPIHFRPGKPGLKFFLSALAVLLAARCGGRIYLVNSFEPGRAIVIDGEADDWAGGLSYVGKDRLFVGFVDDKENLYICLTREGSEGRPGAFMQGLTVWLDPSGGTTKVTGIRLNSGRPSGEGKSPDGRPLRGTEEERPERGDERPSPPRAEIEILGPRREILAAKSLEQAAEEGLEVKADFSGGLFVLEMKIPLAASTEHPFAVGIGSGKMVGVGITTEKTGRTENAGRPPGGGMGEGGGQPGGGGMPGGMGGGRGGMGGGMRRDPAPDSPRTIRIWMKVRLGSGVDPGRSSVLDISSETPRS
jgi:hypothetical protein